uniref:Uncharacterized protein n=1 Tax=Odontobuthus doriae TaxID=342590 RepID=A0A0U4H1J3_ODODO|nr:hypothetical protein HP4 [Odontobuthus doriae]
MKTIFALLFLALVVFVATAVAVPVAYSYGYSTHPFGASVYHASSPYYGYYGLRYF